MNEQKPPNSIEWTRVYGRRGFTWNATADATMPASGKCRTAR